MKYGLIGEKLGHSFSKEIHGMLGDYQYDLTEVKKAGFADFIRSRGFCGVNITIPYKQTVIDLLDEISDNAKKIGAVNTVVNRGGKLCGYNTDYLGLREMMTSSEIPVRENTVLILGTGGTSATVSAVCEAMGARKILKVSRNPDENSISYALAREKYCNEPVVIINTTPCGMFPDDDGVPIDIGGFYKLRGVVDVIFNPLRTRLVSKAKKIGVPAVGGLYMLVAQAVYASELFFDRKYPADTVRKVYRQILSDKTNVVLTGMPSCGKTSVGKLLSEQLGRKFYDSDAEFEKRLKLSPAQYILKYGEDAFRAEETKTISELSVNTGCIIATGGGAVLRAENIERLKLNGKLYFIDRMLSKLIPTDDRPLSGTAELIEKRFNERYSIYKGTADCSVGGDGTVEDTADKIRMLMK